MISVQGAIVGTKDGQKASQELDNKFSPKKKEARQEWGWLPGRWEVWNSIPTPKDWEIPEWIEAAEAEEREGAGDEG